MEQRNETWLEWRKNGIGSSDAPVILGVSPWKTRFELWEEKLAEKAEEKTANWAQQKGIDLEPKARSAYELVADCEMPPITVEHKTYSFLRASLDGWNAEHSRVLEIKCPGKEDHEIALGGGVPAKYLPQVYHLLMVTGAKRLDYFSYRDGRGVIVIVHPDEEYIQSLLKEEIAFWELITTKTPPELTARDYKEVAGEVASLLRDWKAVKETLDTLSARAEELRKLIIEKAPHKRFKGAGVRVSQIIRKGNIDYKNIPLLSCVDLEPYRKKQIEAWEFRMDGKLVV